MQVRDWAAVTMSVSGTNAIAAAYEGALFVGALDQDAWKRVRVPF